MIYKKQELLALREHLCSPPIVGRIRVAHLLNFGVVFCLSFSCVSSVAGVSGLSIRNCFFRFSMIFMQSVSIHLGVFSFFFFEVKDEIQ